MTMCRGLGTMQENAKVASEKTKDKAGDIAMKAKDTMHGAASGKCGLSWQSN